MEPCVSINAMEDLLNGICNKVYIELINNVQFDNWARAEIPKIVSSYKLSFLPSLKRGEVKSFYKNTIQGKHIGQWDFIILKLSVKLCQHYQDLILEQQKQEEEDDAPF
jgi:hypothetical protein